MDEHLQEKLAELLRVGYTFERNPHVNHALFTVKTPSGETITTDNWQTTSIVLAWGHYQQNKS